jgi:23S rRNA (adenine2030-N6)-methyltransferase
LVEAQRFAPALRRSAFPPVLRAQLTIRSPSAPPRLHGSGMVVVNPPFTLEQELSVVLPALAAVLADEGRGGVRIDWIAGE